MRIIFSLIGSTTEREACFLQMCRDMPCSHFFPEPRILTPEKLSSTIRFHPILRWFDRSLDSFLDACPPGRVRIIRFAFKCTIPLNGPAANALNGLVQRARHNLLSRHTCSHGTNAISRLSTPGMQQIQESIKSFHFFIQPAAAT